MTTDLEYSYYVFSAHNLRGHHFSIQDPQALPFPVPEGLEFLPDEYPLKVVSAVAVQVPPPSIRTTVQAAVVSTDYRGPVSIWEGGWVTEFIDPSIEINGVRQSNPNAVTVAELACRHTALLLPNSVADQAIGKFVTTNRYRTHCQVSCNVRLRLKCWDQVRGWLTIWKKFLETSDGLTPSDIGYDPLIAQFESQAVSAIRSRLQSVAVSTGPVVGSFIPCALVDSNSVIERCCVYEIQSMSSSNEATSGILHILTSEAPVNIRNLRLVTRCLGLDQSFRDSGVLGIIE
ncbi:hypothetical protein [Gimesia sp.]|uniref:hypothetical protein n=1 Tax=Gimesia sp. TaxID=2024833 RepID=UPI003A95C9B9